MNPPVPFELEGQHCWLSAERCLYWEEARMLIISDLHFGKTGHFRKSGINVPQSVYKEDLHRLFHQVQHFKPESIVVTGDLFHSRENQEHEWFARWRKDISGITIHLVKGNHDSLPNSVYENLDLIVHENEFVCKPFRFIHDPAMIDTEPEKFYYTISGHIHPGVRISGTGKQSLSFPCFYFSEVFAVLPAFSAFTGHILVETSKKDRVFAIVKGRREQTMSSIIQIQ